MKLVVFRMTISDPVIAPSEHVSMAWMDVGEEIKVAQMGLPV